MRPAARLALAATTALAVSLPLAGVAIAAPEPTPGASTGTRGAAAVPSRDQVENARAKVSADKREVAELEAALAAATARMETASMEAGMAAERYNGAMWRLDEARKASTQAQRESRAAALSVQHQQEGIVQLVTDSYQNGTELNSATALMSDEGPAGLMRRHAVVESAGESMEASYDAFRTASARAKASVKKAAKAQDRQASLAKEAKGLAVVAGQAASAAGAAANQIAEQKQRLVHAVAAAENISVELATRRQAGLEQVARQKAAAAERSQHVTRQAVLERAAARAAKQAARAARTARETRSSSGSVGTPAPGPVAAPSPVANPAPNQATAVKRVIAYAKAQLGKPYLWAASGPRSFDCSGLTMMAWARGGKSLPHYSVAQFAQSTRVSMPNARAGDLLFWSNNGSPSGIHHVALYLGGGQFIEAPRTGSFVQYNSIYNWYPDFVARP